MREELRKFISYLKKQRTILITVFGVLAALIAVKFIFDVSIYKIILDNISEFYKKWGLLFIFLVSIIEGMLFVNWYFPGSFIVLAGALLSRQGLLPFWSFLAVVFIGFTLAFTADYFIGRYGFHKILIKFKFFTNKIDAARKALKKNALFTFLIWYVHPQSGNFVATAAGILKYNFLKFLLLNAISGFVWILLWTGSVYIFGGVVLQLIDDYAYILLFAALISWVLVGYIKERKSFA